MPPRRAAAKKGGAAAAKKGKAAAAAKEVIATDAAVVEEQASQVDEAPATTAAVANDDDEPGPTASSSTAVPPKGSTTESVTQEDQAAGTSSAAAAETTATLTVEERKAKIKALRQRMTESAKANRQDLISESNARRDSARNLAKLERKRKQAEAMGEKQEALETGEDLERKRAWEYTIEDNERWDKKVARKNRRADFSFTDYDDIARRKYKKDMDVFKPDHASYNKQRAAAQEATALIASSSSNPDAAALIAAQDLYRDANSFVYADHKPSEDAIDRVIGKINIDLDKRQKRSRERKNEVEGDITYINEKNKHFNKKLERYYDAVTKDIRDSFERGTAL